jgi:polar amino acid transport system substrate-binding protein
MESRFKKNNFALFIILILMLVLGEQSLIWAKQAVTIYGDNDYPPYSYIEDNKPKGIYVDVLKLVFTKMPDYEVSFSMVSWNFGLACIKRGECMALFPPYIAENRLPWMLYSEPILSEQVVVFGKKEKLKGKTKWPQDFFGYHMGLNRGFHYRAMGGKSFADACRTGKIKLQEAESNDLNLRKLEKDRIDFYLNDRLIDISMYPSIVRGIVVKKNLGHLGFTRNDAKFKFLSDFRKQFNSNIKEIKASNQIEKIIQRYIKK